MKNAFLKYFCTLTIVLMLMPVSAQAQSSSYEAGASAGRLFLIAFILVIAWKIGSKIYEKIQDKQDPRGRDEWR